jgi:cell division protein FtsQ
MKFKRVLKYLFFVGFLISLGLLYSFSSYRNVSKKVAAIDIQFSDNEHFFVTREMVDKLLIQNDSSLINQPKSIVDLFKLEQSLLENPYVENADVFLTLSGTLKSVVKQREPVARILSEKESYYIDKHGVKVPLSSLYSARVLLVTGVKNEADILELQQLLKLILEDEFLKKEITGIEKKPNNAYQFSVRSGNYKIDFGKIKDKQIKFEKLKAFYSKTFADKSIEKYKTISLKYHNQVVCTK